MGSWDTSIKGNDTTLDVYTFFFDKYNEGEDPEEISKLIKKEFDEYFTDFDQKHDALFGFALAQWETKCLEKEILKEVKSIIVSGVNLKFWGEDKIILRKREKELNKFLIQISTERSKQKRRQKPKFVFNEVVIAKAISPDNKKEFKIADEYVNGKYIHTQGVMTWYSGGGSGILCYNLPNAEISLKWQNKKSLTVLFNNDIQFSKQESCFFYCGDEGNIEYIKK